MAASPAELANRPSAAKTLLGAWQITQRAATLLFFILTLTLSGCGLSLGNSVSNISTLRTVPPGEAIVVGRVKLILEGKPLDLSGWELPFSYAVRIFLLPDGISKEDYHVLSGDGSFFWLLPPNNYTLTAFSVVKGPRTLSGRIFAQFAVPREKTVIYVGTLIIRLVGEQYYLAVEDDFGDALNELKKRFPKIDSDVAGNLMQLEKPL